jgi:predicted RNA-binding protein with PIN domain
LLVDGYNIIHAWKDFKPYLEDSLYIAREKLLEILSDYAGFRNEIIIAVFDAHKVAGNPGVYEKRGNIHVVYTKESQTADSYIELFVSSNSKEYEIWVATSDVTEQIIILGRGAKRLNADQLRSKVFSAKKELKDRYLHNAPVKKNTFLENLDPETAKLLDSFRFKKET